MRGCHYATSTAVPLIYLEHQRDMNVSVLFDLAQCQFVTPAYLHNNKLLQCLFLSLAFGQVCLNGADFT